MPTIAEIVDIYPIAQYLAANDIAKKGLYGGGVDVELPNKIYMVGKNVKRIFDYDPSDSTLPATARYLYGLCGIYGSQALVVVQNAGTIASVTPPSSSLAQTIDWIVSGTASATAPLATGNTTVTFDGTSGMPDLRGYNMDYFRGGQPQYTTNPGDGSTYYSWNRVSGVFAISSGAALGEQMRISPIG